MSAEIRDGIDPAYDDPDAYGTEESFYDDGRYPPDWEARRKAVYRRDDYTCQRCGEQSGYHADGDGTKLHAHHERSLSEGGSNRLRNLVTLCERCHDLEHEHDVGFDGEDEQLPDPLDGVWPARRVVLAADGYVPVSRQRRIEDRLEERTLILTGADETRRVGHYRVRVVDMSPRARHVRPVATTPETTVQWEPTVGAEGRDADDHATDGTDESRETGSTDRNRTAAGTDDGRRVGERPAGPDATESTDGNEEPSLLEALLPWR